MWAGEVCSPPQHTIPPTVLDLLMVLQSLDLRIGVKSKTPMLTPTRLCVPMLTLRLCRVVRTKTIYLSVAKATLLQGIVFGISLSVARRVSEPPVLQVFGLSGLSIVSLPLQQKQTRLSQSDRLIVFGLRSLKRTNSDTA